MFSRMLIRDAEVVGEIHEVILRVLRVAPVYLVVCEEIRSLRAGEPMSPVRRVFIMYR